MKLAALVALTALTLTAAAAPKTADDLFVPTKVWTLHLTFTPDQFAAMEPKTTGPGFMPGPGAMLAPVFMTSADADKDSRISRPEFQALADKWFTQWDTDKSGRLTSDKLRDGLSAAFAPPPPGPNARGPGGPGMIRLQGPDGRRNGLASAAGLEFPFVHADLEFEGQSFKNVGVRYKGNGTFMQSRFTNKRSLKIDLDQFDDTQKLAGHSQLNLHNCVTDASYMNEVLSHRLYRDAGAPAPRTAYARVYITVPGKHDRHYLGLYSLVEDIGKPFADDRFKSKKGSLFKPVTPQPFSDLGDDWAKYKQTYDPKGNISEKESRRVIDFAKLVTKADDAQFNARLADYLDLPAFARYIAVTVYLSTIDSILGVGQNYYLYLNPKTDKFQFIPWDLDHSFGQFFIFGNQDQREKLSIHKPWRGDIRFLERVFAHEPFKTAYLAELQRLSSETFNPDRFHQQVDEIAAAIRPAVQEESPEKLARFDKAVKGEPVEPAAFGPPPNAPGGATRPAANAPPPPQFRMPPVKPIKAFVTPRSQSISDQLAGKSKGVTLDDSMFGFGPPPGPATRPGAATRPAGPNRFGPGAFMAPVLLNSMDTDKDQHLTRDEMHAGLTKWFEAWDKDKDGHLNDDQLRDGINQMLTPPQGPGRGPAPRPQ